MAKLKDLTACVLCGDRLVDTFWGPVSKEGYVCRFDHDPNADDQGQHVVIRAWTSRSRASTQSQRTVSVQTSSRPTWDIYFLSIAEAVSYRADCSRSKVGCIIVDRRRRIISTGYNGSASGGPSCLAGECPRGRFSLEEVPPGTGYDSGIGTCHALHAEANALIYGNPTLLEGGTAYITRSPCTNCEKLLSGSGVARVVWPEGELTF